ncbi:hypothetical protein CTI12_AA584390 [Artemisia annua]|uniref:Uncharacterized protein n=1 Tax=Artemisia annua TaxID=35608 RepID=A0A2U1KNE6_ARTAN|nr:hypothetical protein CTI12_AA584390 [Artemisia annua]
MAAMQQDRRMLQKYHHTKIGFEVKASGNGRAFCWPMCTRKHCSSMLLPYKWLKCGVDDRPKLSEIVAEMRLEVLEILKSDWKW